MKKTETLYKSLIFFALRSRQKLNKMKNLNIKANKFKLIDNSSNFTSN